MGLEIHDLDPRAPKVLLLLKEGRSAKKAWSLARHRQARTMHLLAHSRTRSRWYLAWFWLSYVPPTRMPSPWANSNLPQYRPIPTFSPFLQQRWEEILWVYMSGFCLLPLLKLCWASVPAFCEKPSIKKSMILNDFRSQECSLSHWHFVLKSIPSENVASQYTVDALLWLALGQRTQVYSEQ